MWSLRGHTMSALNLGFNSRFLMSIPTLSYTKSSPPPPGLDFTLQAIKVQKSNL